MADLTPDLQESLSWGSIAESFHSLRSLSVSCFQVILGLPGPCFPLTCMSKAVLTAPLERSTCPYQRSFLSFSMRSRSSIQSRASSSMDLMVAVSCGLTCSCGFCVLNAEHIILSLVKTRLKVRLLCREIPNEKWYCFHLYGCDLCQEWVSTFFLPGDFQNDKIFSLWWK